MEQYILQRLPKLPTTPRGRGLGEPLDRKQQQNREKQ
jgi:hypothetical protein